VRVRDPTRRDLHPAITPLAGNKGLEPSASRLARYSTPVAHQWALLPIARGFLLAQHLSVAALRVIQESNLFDLAACGGMEFCVGAPQTTTLPEVATECNVRESNPLPMLGKHRCHHQHLRCMKPRPGIEPGPRLYQRRVLPLALKRREAYERSRTLHLHLTTGQGTRYTQAWSRLPQEESDLRHLIQSQASYR
jgi:hypothetical protein